MGDRQSRGFCLEAPCSLDPCRCRRVGASHVVVSAAVTVIAVHGASVLRRGGAERMNGGVCSDDCTPPSGVVVADLEASAACTTTSSVGSLPHCRQPCHCRVHLVRTVQLPWLRMTAACVGC